MEFLGTLPKLPPKLPLFKLAAFDSSPIFEALRAGQLPSQAPKLGSTPQKPDGKNDTRVRRGDDGSFEIYPSFNEFGRENAQPWGNAAGKLLESLSAGLENLVPRDPQSTFFVDDARLLHHAKIKRGQTTMIEEAPRLMYAGLRRRVGEYPVDGPGSRVVVGFDASGKVRAARYEWKAAAPSETVQTTLTVDKVQDTIREALLQLQVGDFRVKNVELVYYDSGRQLLQPAIRYVAEQLQSRESLGGSDHLTGYLPYAKTNEPLPLLATRIQPQPATEVADRGARSKASPLVLHRYVVRDDSESWGIAADDLWRSLKAASGPLIFKGAKYQDTWPYHYSGRKDKHINAADVALLEAHGFPFGFTTFKDRGDSVQIAVDIPTSGLGAASGGRLKHWILHSCESLPVVPEYRDAWANQWWELFKGLSSVVGYRSSMFIADGAEAALAPSLRWGAPVVPAWFSAVASLNIYALDSEAMFACAKEDQNIFPMGRASAITACEQADLSAAERGPDSTECLEAWWMASKLVPSTRRPPRALASSGTIPVECPKRGGPGIGNFDPPLSD